MRIEKVSLERFKAFPSLELDLRGRDTVFFGVNGSGKSTVLSALAYLSQVWLRKLNASQGKGFGSIDDAAITSGEQDMRIACEISLDSDCFELSRTANARVSNRRMSSYAYDRTQYGRFLDSFRLRYLDGGDGQMPIFAYYGTNRSVLSLPTNLPEDGQYDQLSALERACDNTADFKRFFAWYRDQESKGVIALRDALVRGRAEGGNQDSSVTWGDLANSNVTWGDLASMNGSIELEGVRRVVASMVEGVTQLYIRRDPVRFTAVKDGKELNIDLLSDGEKCTIALLGDLVRRLCLANPGLDDPLRGSGVVVIDEVELHMHPAWQRRIMGQLRANFPNLQFIVATHSPQVLGELDATYNIVLLDPTSSTAPQKAWGRMDGFDSSYILEEFMGTRSQNPLAERLYQRACDAIDEGSEELTLKTMDELADLVGRDGREYLQAKNHLIRHRMLMQKQDTQKAMR